MKATSESTGSPQGSQINLNQWVLSRLSATRSVIQFSARWFHSIESPTNKSKRKNSVFRICYIGALKDDRSREFTLQLSSHRSRATFPKVLSVARDSDIWDRENRSSGCAIETQRYYFIDICDALCSTREKGGEVQVHNPWTWRTRQID